MSIKKKDCALLVAPIVALSVYRFYMIFWGGFPIALASHVRKIGLWFGNSWSSN